MDPSAPAVIVVGSGLAGLCAAHAALEAGAPRVHLLERASKPGGNSIKASSGINGAGTPAQRAAGVAVDASFYSDTVRSAGARFVDEGDAEPAVDRNALVSKLTAQSAAAVAWLVDDIGVDLSAVALLGGHSVARTHRGAGKTPPGAAIVRALVDRLAGDPRFTLAPSTLVTRLLTAPGVPGGANVAVRGVACSDSAHVSEGSPSGPSRELLGPVVFAAGGFAGDAHGLLAKHRPDLAGMPSTNDAQPSPHHLLGALGAEFIDMSEVQVHPTGFVDPRDEGAQYKFLAAEALRGEGGIMLDSATGRRFVNELDTRDAVSAAIMALPRADAGHVQASSPKAATRQWDVTLLLDAAACEALAGHLEFYLWKGLMRKARVRDLPDQVVAAVDEHAANVARAADDALGRPSYGRWGMPPGEKNRDMEVCLGTVTPVVHFTMGGVACDVDARVLGTALRPGGQGHGGRQQRLAPLQGIWAAGEVTGGVHGANRLGGSSLLECVVFGRTAGREAARSLAPAKA